jgi:polysaccharide export outer membrane protein
VAAAGCTPRGPGSRYVAAPIDYAQARWEADLTRLSARPELTTPPEEYLLGPGDILAISLVGRPDLLGENQERLDNRARFVLSESPYIVLPYVGAVVVHDKSVEQLQEEITAAYDRIVRDPIVFVTVEKYHWNQVAVLGSVKVPGRYPLEAGDTMLDAIFKAGGLTLGGKTGELPPARVLKLYRPGGTDDPSLETDLDRLMEQIRQNASVVEREEVRIPLDTFLLGGDLRYNLPLMPGDIIYVPPAGTVTVHGDVKSPRVVFLGPGLRTLAQVLTECGSLTFRATSTIEVVRSLENGETESIYVDARAVMARREADMFMEDNDQVFVYPGPVRSVLGFLGSFFKATATTGVNATYNPAQ